MQSTNSRGGSALRNSACGREHRVLLSAHTAAPSSSYCRSPVADISPVTHQRTATARRCKLSPTAVTDTLQSGGPGLDNHAPEYSCADSRAAGPRACQSRMEVSQLTRRARTWSSSRFSGPAAPPAASPSPCGTARLYASAGRGVLR